MVSGIIIWLALIAAFVIIFHKHIEVHFPIFLIKNKKIGEWIYKRCQKHTRLIKAYADVGIVVGLLGIGVSVWFLSKGLLRQVLNWVEGVSAPASVNIVIPGVHIPGSTVFIPLVEGLIAIAVLAIVHEFAHAAVASAVKLKPKSVALVIMAFIPAAGVELDEKKMKQKLGLRDKLRIYAAGSFTNFIIGGIFFALMIGLTFFIMHAYVVPVGMQIVSVENNTAAWGVLEENMTIININGEPSILPGELANIEFTTGGIIGRNVNFYRVASNLSANETVLLEMEDGQAFNITTRSWSESDPGRGRIGIVSYPKVSVEGGTLVQVLA